MFEKKEELPLNQLYSKEAKIQLKILNAFYRNYEGFTIDELSEKIDISSKTIYKYIKEINKISISSTSKILISISQKNSNYQFTGSKIDFLTLRYQIIESTEAIKLIWALLSNSSVTFYDFCTTNYVSESTLRNIVRTLNSMMNFLNLKIIIRKNQIYINGNEAIIRYCFTSIIWRVYNGLKYPFYIIDETKLSKLRDIISMDFPVNISNGKKDLFLLFLLVSVIRASHSPLLYKELPVYTPELTCKSVYFKKLKEILKNKFILKDTEIQFILLLFYTFPEFYNLPKRNEYTFNKLKKINNDTFNSIENYLEFIKLKHPECSLKSTSAQTFISATLSVFISVDIFKEAFFNLQDLNLIQFSSKEFPMLLPSIQKIISAQNPKLKQGVLKSLVFRLAQSYLVSFSPRDFEPIINILLITDSPLYVERGTILKLKRILSYKFNAKISTEVSSIDSIDLVIATGIYRDNPKDIPTVYIFPQIEERDKITILKVCDEIYSKKIIKSKNNLIHEKREK